MLYVENILLFFSTYLLPSNSEPISFVYTVYWLFFN
nr:MAG TPA: hypothetical protein [Caudoviricetes sp.]